ncbi:hypothetical protein E3N88_15595 [Mikania micrantha]|uniref:Uncharacterized protein n=1 Tax=Mikania micrantha TaxID=192012 RepID=A0A5N6NZ21_9ASTR|nr:hypothetical protein E3N88_15595 [Mikania micrantha]
MSRKKSERIALKTSFSKFVNSPLDPIQLGDSDTDMNTRTVAKRFKTDEEKLKMIMEIKANLENVKKKIEEDKRIGDEEGLKIKKAKKTKKKKMNKKSDYELDDEFSDDPDYDNNRDEIIEKVVTSDKQKKCGIPSKLGHYVVDNLDTSRMVIKTFKGYIKVDKESVNALLGLPLGGIDISALTEANECTKLFSKWRRRYGRRRISPGELVSNISIDKYEDEIVFKLDFLVLFLTTVDCWRNGLRKYALIGRLDLELDLNDYDWCGYVVDAIKRGKEGWKRCTRSPPFGINENKEVSTIQFWSFENLQKCEGIEIKEGGLGLGEIREHSVEEVNYEMGSEEPLLEGDNNDDDDVETDERAKKMKCGLLRKKYACKMLTSDVNIYKDRVIKEANELDGATTN